MFPQPVDQWIQSMLQFGADPHQWIADFLVVAEIQLEFGGRLVVDQVAFILGDNHTYTEAFSCNEILVKQVLTGCRLECENHYQSIDIGRQGFFQAAISGTGQYTVAGEQRGDDALTR